MFSSHPIMIHCPKAHRVTATFQRRCQLGRNPFFPAGYEHQNPITIPGRGLAGPGPTESLFGHPQTAGAAHYLQPPTHAARNESFVHHSKSCCIIMGTPQQHTDGRSSKGSDSAGVWENSAVSSISSSCVGIPVRNRREKDPTKRESSSKTETGKKHRLPNSIAASQRFGRRWKGRWFNAAATNSTQSINDKTPDLDGPSSRRRTEPVSFTLTSLLPLSECTPDEFDPLLQHPSVRMVHEAMQTQSVCCDDVERSDGGM